MYTVVQPSPQSSFRTGTFLRWQCLTKGVNLTGMGPELTTLQRASILLLSSDSTPRLELGSDLLQVSNGWCVLCQAASQRRLFRQLGEQRSCLVLIKQYWHLCPQHKIDSAEFAGHTRCETNLFFLTHSTSYHSTHTHTQA